MIGAESGQESVVELLLHSGALLHLCDASNCSALELALQNGHLQVRCTRPMRAYACVFFSEP